jgi:hypothetical protein
MKYYYKPTGIALKKRKKEKQSQVWCCTPVIPALRMLREKDGKFRCSLGCIARPCLNKTRMGDR